MAKTGGYKTVALDVSQMPGHTHSVNDYYLLEKTVPKAISGTEPIPGSYSGSGATDSDNNTMVYRTHNTASAGSGSAHENRPPYFVLAYIMKTKN